MAVKQNLISVLLIIIIAIISCTKPDNFPPEPSISNLRFSSDTVSGLTNLQLGSEEKFDVYFDFVDGDANLGSSDENKTNVWLINLNTTDTSFFRMEKMDIGSDENGIQGTTTIKYSSCCSLDGLYYCVASEELNEYEELQIELWIEDEDGNESNHITSQASIVLSCRY